MIWIVSFLATIPIANWMIGNVGTTCIPDGPCLVPVWPGLMAPSGVLVIGLAFVLRDVVQRRYGWKVAMTCVGGGAVLSGLVAPPALAFASVVAFGLAESVDCAVYTWLRRRFMLAVIASSVVGIALDSVAFLWLAFGSLDHLAGQVVGKLLMVAAGAALLAMARSVLLVEGET